MSRFYFDLMNGPNTVRDDRGVEASSLTEAAEQGRAAVKDVRDNGEAPALEDGWWLVIRDETEMTLRSISLDDSALH